MSTDPTRGHHSWIKIKGWRDSVDPRTGRAHAQIGQPGDFTGAIAEESRGGSGRRPGRVFTWRVCRQRTEREGPDAHGLHWSPDLAAGEAPTLAQAKSAATTALRAQRMEHILAGGDVGYGDAPTGEQIRSSIAARRALQPGQSLVMESGDLDGVQWQRRLSSPKGTIGTTESFRLVYNGHQLDTLIKGRTPVQAAEEWREHVDGIPRRQAAADQAQQEKIADSVRIMLGHERERARLNPLDYTQVADAWKAAHGRPAPKSLLSHWAHDGVTQAEHDAGWYQNGLRAKQVREAATPDQLRPQARREMAAGLDCEATETAHRADVAAGEPPRRTEMLRQREELRAAGERNARGQARHMTLAQARRIHLKETTGLDLPHPADMKAGAANREYMIATDHLLAGRLDEGRAALDRAKQTAAESRNRGALARLEKLSAQVDKATPQAAPPALVRIGPARDGTITALDQHGTEYTVSWRDGEITVTSPAGTLSGPDGGDPTAAARELAGQLAARTLAAVPDMEPEA